MICSPTLRFRTAAPHFQRRESVDQVLLCDETLLGALREGISALGEFVGTDGTDDQWLMCLEHGDL